MNAAEGFTGAYALLDEITGWLATDGAGLTHAELEDELEVRGRELLRTVVPRATRPAVQP